MNNEYPVLDGIAPSWADIDVILTGTDIVLLSMKDIASITTGRTVEVGEQRSGGRVIKRTSGDSSQEAGWGLYRSGFQKMLRTLMTAAVSRNYVRGNKVLISLVHFDIQIKHTPPGDVEIYQRIIKGARVISDALNGAEGTDADKVDVGLSVAEIVDIVDGKEIVLL